MALLAKWWWRLTSETNSFWGKVIHSIRGKGKFSWHTVGKGGLSLQSPWIGISRVWLQVEAFAGFKIGNGHRISFWHDNWLANSVLSLRFPWLFGVARKPDCSVADHWDDKTSAWAVFFRRLVKMKSKIFSNFSRIYQIKPLGFHLTQDAGLWNLLVNFRLNLSLEAWLLKITWSKMSIRFYGNQTVQKESMYLFGLCWMAP